MCGACKVPKKDHVCSKKREISTTEDESKKKAKIADEVPSTDCVHAAPTRSEQLPLPPSLRLVVLSENGVQTDYVFNKRNITPPNCNSLVWTLFPLFSHVADKLFD